MSEFADSLSGVEPGELPRDPSLRIPFPLDKKCGSVRLGIPCDSTNGHIRPNPYGPDNLIHYTRECGRCGAHKDHVSATRVALHLGISLRTKTRGETATELFEPTPQVRIAVVLRDHRTCVYLGCEQGKQFTDGTTIRCDADHIIPRIKLHGKGIEKLPELYEFARNRQLVTACQKHNSAKGTMLAPYEQLERLFRDVVLRGSENKLEIYLLRRLYQAALNPPEQN